MNLESIKSQFPIFQQKTPVGKELVYLDNASTTQKPDCVIDAIADFYKFSNANAGRGVYWPATEVTGRVVDIRQRLAKFIGAARPEEVVFTHGVTDALNKLALAIFGGSQKREGQVLVSGMEHHSNFVPWQMAARHGSLPFKVIPLTDSGAIDMEAYAQLLKEPTSLVAVSAASNVTGIGNDISRLSQMAHNSGALLVVDASQAVAHQPIDVRQWDCDFMVFSGHKAYGPTGIGVLYGTYEVLAELNPLAYGGGMVQEVNESDTTFRMLPHRHEAGTLNLAGIVGLEAAIAFIEKQGIANIQAHENALYELLRKKLNEVSGVAILGRSSSLQCPVVSFTVEGVHPHDMATYLATEGISIRAGHHCAQPLMKHFGITACSRISLACYSSRQEIEQTVDQLKEAIAFFR
ncbi:aminotransferase class V-fold PLP-dependent enzyme [Roseivirga thermotolerans]|uniref:aminotransferase class V-fold PLP-dependent enzyme n=1 Tax=Roseivirga thermotolerans TaxID=1758176 RepID=UPI00273F60B7|nr:SufS family cysteine desulfurase [Roseivirga thermotolerans]